MIKQSKSKILQLFFVVIMMSCILTSCVMPSHDNLYDDLESIIKNENTYSVLKSVSKVEDNTFKKSVESFSGIETIWKCDSEKDEVVDMKYQLSVLKGSVKLVLITGSDNLVEIVELSEGDAPTELLETTLSTEKGMNMIKVIAKDKAEYELYITTSKGGYEK